MKYLFFFFGLFATIFVVSNLSNIRSLYTKVLPNDTKFDIFESDYLVCKYYNKYTVMNSSRI